MSRKISDNYLKVVEWSKEDGCYVGTAPGLIYGGVHGRDEQKVFQELCEVVEKAIKEMEKAGMPLPPETANKDYSGKLALRISPGLHRKIAIKARQTGESINKFIQTTLEKI